MNSLIIKEAKKKYPKAEFKTGDLLTSSLREQFDYVFESGIFNIKIANWERFTRKVLVQMYRISKIGVGANFLSDFTPFKKNKKSYYVNPFGMLKFVLGNLSNKFVLRHDYKPNDFMVYIYKNLEK